jgi:hypothetical protein
MFSIKFYHKKEKRGVDFSNTINTMVNFIFKKLNIPNSRVVSDNSCIEIISGKEIVPNNNEVVVELLIRKHILIKNEDFNNREKLDEHIFRIKHFCKQAKDIDDLKYLPINMR